MSDPTAVRLKAGYTLTLTETALVFLEDARCRGELCQPLYWIPEVGRIPSDGWLRTRELEKAVTQLLRSMVDGEVAPGV
ncbi:hypothetical protein ABZ614_45895 [Streptomyces sp. NPDC013178]|uniref:hypothetical protein n=1 Tax=Streptomyces sp. NPDC013178 TaxID=3155118 RepID=UPI0033C9D950